MYLFFYSRVVYPAHPIVFHSNNLESTPKYLAQADGDLRSFPQLPKKKEGGMAED